MKPGKSGLTVMILKDRFQGKTAIVTGGASGIARKISERFVAEGGRIAVFDVQEEAEKALCHNLGDDLARAFVCNVADRACVEDAVNRACEFLGHIDCLFNVAGLPCRNCFLDITDEQFERCFSVNVKGYLNMSRAVGKQMKEQGTGGAIVNFNSISAYLIDDYSVGYTITKGATLSMTRAMAIGLMPYGIRVNGVSPGFTETPMTEHTWSDPEKHKFVLNRIPLGRGARPEEQAACALFLASDDASFVYGHDLICDGGVYIKN